LSFQKRLGSVLAAPRLTQGGVAVSQTVDTALRILSFLGDPDRDIADIAAMLGIHNAMFGTIMHTSAALGPKSPSCRQWLSKTWTFSIAAPYP
jgi:hypothetical protein